MSKIKSQEASCSLCKKPAELDLSFMTQGFCRDCYTRVIEKRIRRYIRVSKLFSANDDICIVDNNSIGFKVTKYLIESLSQKLPLKIEFETNLDNAKKKKYDKILISKNNDDISDEFLDKLFYKDITALDKIDRKVFSILIPVSEKELFYFAKFKGFTSKNEEKPKVHILDEFDDLYPETKFAFGKSIKELNNILSKKN